jgi:putative methionine-R-sulfoxide reductase with GAF domain
MNTTPSTMSNESQRFGLWGNLPLVRKLLIAFSALAVLALVVGIVANLGLNSVKNSYEHSLSDGEALKSTSLTLSNNLLLARRHEKDFLARWHDEGFDTAYTNYVVPNQQAIAEILKNITVLSTFAPAVGETFRATYPQTQYEADLATLKQSTDQYEQNFQKMVQLSKERGFNDTGLEGQFRTDVHNIEALIIGREDLNPLVITMLTIRRHEKDYLLRGEQTYIDQTHQSVIDLKQQVASSDVLTATEKKDITALADQYVVSFDALVAKDVEVAAATQAFRDAAHTMEPLVTKLTSTGADLSQSDATTARTFSSRTLLYSSVTLLAALLVAIFLSVALARQITDPIRSLTNTAQIISEGKFDIQAEVTSADEIGSLAQNFNIMTTRLAQAFEDVRRRAAELATVAEVSTATSTILEVTNLLQEVVNLTKERFNLYHSHIYLLDESGENLVLASGAGEAGRQMVAEKRSIPLNREQSLVARAAREQKGVTVNDVTQAPDFLPNILLPDTRSELAVPMIVGGKVIGVFDVQSDVVGRFTDSDINIQTTLAAQVATSVQNVRSFEQSKTQADFESLVNSIGQKIQRTTSVEDTLQTAIRELGLALGAKRVKANIGNGNGANEARLN